MDGGCNPGGSGSRVTAGSVIFRPFFTATDQDIPLGPLPGDALILTLSPHRWFVPADGSTKVWFTLSLHDGLGRPLPGRQVQLWTAQASVSPVSITDIHGQALAYATSSQAGDAVFAAKLYDKTACEFVQASSATMTFAAPGELGLLPDSAAPYFTDEIQVSPEPIVVGVPTTISATLTNPNSFPITVDVTFSFQGAHIGLPFLPVGEVTGTVIPANSSVTVQALWLPTASGHYCFDVEATAYAASNQRLAAPKKSKGRRNVSVAPGPFLKPSAKNAAQKASVATDAIGDAQWLLSAATDRASMVVGFIQDQLFGNILDFIYDGGNAINCALAGGTSCGGWRGPHLKLPGDSLGNLRKDPPSQDYKTIVTIDPIAFTPLQPGPTMPAPRASALNAVMSASLDMLNNAFAAVAAYDRYAGATEANDLEWESLQANAHLYYLDQLANALVTTANAIDALVTEVHSEGLVDVSTSAQDFLAYQNRLLTQGFTAEEIAAGQLVGFDDAALEAIRQRRLALDAATEAGSVLQGWSNLAQAFRELGAAIYEPPAFGVSASYTGGGAARPRLVTPAHDLVTLFESETEFTVGNPLTVTATIDLLIRPLDLPAGWLATVSPHTVTLAPGEQITATASLTPGGSAIQGTTARVAVEGYVGKQLLGGVVVEVAVPEYAPYPVKRLNYLPMVIRGQ